MTSTPDTPADGRTTSRKRLVPAAAAPPDIVPAGVLKKKNNKKRRKVNIWCENTAQAVKKLFITFTMSSTVCVGVTTVNKTCCKDVYCVEIFRNDDIIRDR